MQCNLFFFDSLPPPLSLTHAHTRITHTHTHTHNTHASHTNALWFPIKRLERPCIYDSNAICLQTLKNEDLNFTSIFVCLSSICFPDLKSNHQSHVKQSMIFQLFFLAYINSVIIHQTIFPSIVLLKVDTFFHKLLLSLWER